MDQDVAPSVGITSLKYVPSNPPIEVPSFLKTMTTGILYSQIVLPLLPPSHRSDLAYLCHVIMCSMFSSPTYTSPPTLSPFILQLARFFFQYLALASEPTLAVDMSTPNDPVPTGDQTAKVLGTFITFDILAAIVVILRFVSRRIAHANLWWDDWLMLPAVVSFRPSLYQ